MAPAVARVSANLNLNNVTIYYPADKQSATALAYRNEDLARQRHEPSYEPPCYEITNPRRDTAKVDDDGFGIDLKRKLCDFLGYSDENEDSNKARRLQSGLIASPDTALHQRAPVQGTQGHMRHHNSELTPAFADHARFTANQHAARLPKVVNNDRCRNTHTPSPTLAPPNPAMVTRQLPSARPQNTSQSYGQRPYGSYTPQPVSRQPTPGALQQPVSGPQYAASTRAAMDVRQPSRMTQQEHVQRQQQQQQARPGSLPVAQYPGRSPQMGSPNMMPASTSYSPRMPAITAPRQQQARPGSPPVAQYPGVSPQMRSPSMMPISTSYSPLTSHHMPTMTAPQQQQRSPSSMGNTSMRPQSTSPPGASPRMAQNSPSGGAWSPQRLPAVLSAQSKSPRASDLRRDSPQMVPARTYSPQGAWLGNATSQAMQPHSWAARPPSPPRPSMGALLPAYLSADGQFLVSQKTEDRFCTPSVPADPSRTPDQHQSVREQLQNMKRQEQRDNMTNVSANSQAISSEQNAAQSRPNGAPATARQDTYTGRTSGANLAAHYNLDIPAAASTPSFMRTPVGSRPPTERSSHYMASQSQQQPIPSKPLRNGPFQEAGLRRLFPPAPDGRGGEVQIPLVLSELEIIRLLNGHPRIRQDIEAIQPQGRRRFLHQWCEMNPGFVKEFQQQVQQSLAKASQPRQQQPHPPHQQQQTGRATPVQRSSGSLPSQATGTSLLRGDVQSQHLGQTALNASDPVQRTDSKAAQLTAPSSVETSRSLSRPAPYSVGGKAGTDPIPPEIQQMVATVKALETTNSGLPIRRLLKGLEAGLFAQNGTLLKGTGSKGKDLLEWFGDERLFSADEWHYLRYTASRVSNAFSEHA